MGEAHVKNDYRSKYLISAYSQYGSEFNRENLTLSLIRRFIDTNQSMTKLEHVIAKGDDDELGVLSPVFDVVRDDGDITEI